MTPNEVKTVVDNINDFIEIPDGLEQLRKAVLVLAFSGKLVVQDKKDGTAEELYNQIQKDNSKKIKEITSNEIPFEIPKSWKWIRLINIAEIYNGDSINKQIKESKYSNIISGYPYIATKDINRESHVIDYSNGIKIPLNETNFKIAPKGSVLICSEGGNAGRKIGILSEDVCFGNKLITTIVNSKINSKFIFFTYLADYFQNSFHSKVNGLISGISISNFKYLLVALPPSAEQKRIVEKLEEVFKKLDDLEIKKQKSDKTRTRLARSAMQSFAKGKSKIALEYITELVKTPADIKELEETLLTLAVSGKLVTQEKKEGSAEELLLSIEKIKKELLFSRKLKISKLINTPLTIRDIPLPFNWIWAKGSDFLFITKLAGFEYTKYIKLSDNGEIPVIRAQNVRKYFLDKTNLKYIDKKTSLLLERCALIKPSLLVTFIGAGIGDVALFNENTRWHLAPNVAKMELFENCDSKIDLKYINYYLASQYGQREIFKHVKETAQPSLSMGTIRDIDYPIPPMGEQRRIVKKVDEIMVLIDQLRDVVGGNKNQGRGRPKK